jgi:hypothetical protein
MDQIEKQVLIDAASQEAISQVAHVLRIAPTRESVRPVMELAMGSDLVKVYKLSLYYAIEADRCFEQGAFFASCLLTAAANEAFLALTCFYEQNLVKTTSVFRGLHKPSKAFRDVIADCGLDRLIRISNELGWIPNDVVNAQLLEAIVTDFPKLARTVYPNWNQARIREKIGAFRGSPGAEMLKVMQDMRNLVHAPRWLKTGSILDDTEFEENCKLAVLAGREVVQCLSVRTTKALDQALKGLASFDHLPADVRGRVSDLMLRDI